MLQGKDIDGLSAIEAGTFQQRFVEAMKGHFVEKEDEEEQLFATRSTSSLALSPRESGSEGGGTPRGGPAGTEAWPKKQRKH